MGTKANPGTFDCYAAAGNDEPLFTLLARDRRAPELVRQWAHMRQQDIIDGAKPETDQSKVDEAMTCAQSMEDWYVRNNKRETSGTDI